MSFQLTPKRVLYLVATGIYVAGNTISGFASLPTSFACPDVDPCVCAYPLIDEMCGLS